MLISSFAARRLTFRVHAWSLTIHYLILSKKENRFVYAVPICAGFTVEPVLFFDNIKKIVICFQNHLQSSIQLMQFDEPFLYMFYLKFFL